MPNHNFVKASRFKWHRECYVCKERRFFPIKRIFKCTECKIYAHRECRSAAGCFGPAGDGQVVKNETPAPSSFDHTVRPYNPRVLYGHYFPTKARSEPPTVVKTVVHTADIEISTCLGPVAAKIASSVADDLRRVVAALPPSRPLRTDHYMAWPLRPQHFTMHRLLAADELVERTVVIARPASVVLPPKIYGSFFGPRVTNTSEMADTRRGPSGSCSATSGHSYKYRFPSSRESVVVATAVHDANIEPTDISMCLGPVAAAAACSVAEDLRKFIAVLPPLSSLRSTHYYAWQFGQENFSICRLLVADELVPRTMLASWPLSLMIYDSFIEKRSPELRKSNVLCGSPVRRLAPSASLVAVCPENPDKPPLAGNSRVCGSMLAKKRIRNSLYQSGWRCQSYVTLVLSNEHS